MKYSLPLILFTDGKLWGKILIYMLDLFVIINILPGIISDI